MALELFPSWTETDIHMTKLWDGVLVYRQEGVVDSSWLGAGIRNTTTEATVQTPSTGILCVDTFYTTENIDIETHYTTTHW